MTATLTSDTNSSPREFPKPPSILIIHKKDPQNSLITVILMITLYYRTRIQIKNS